MVCLPLGSLQRSLRAPNWVKGKGRGKVRWKGRRGREGKGGERAGEKKGGEQSGMERKGEGRGIRIPL